MTRTELVLYRNRRLLLLVAVLLTLGGGVALSLILIEREADARRELATEANLRGDAVSVLAGDVRALRAQVEGEGKVPVAPDPTAAVEDLPDRAEVPVPIPGPAGADGEDGVDGEPGASGKPGDSGKAGKDGADGADGVAGEPGPVGATGPAGPPGPQGEPGPAGPQGEPGADGADGADGRDGQSCPEGYSLQAPSWDADALVCRRDGAPDPDDPGNGNGPQAEGALDPQRRVYA